MSPYRDLPRDVVTTLQLPAIGNRALSDCRCTASTPAKDAM